MPAQAGNGGFHELRLLTTDEVAAMLRQSRTTIYRWAKDGRLPAVKLGHSLMFNPEAIEQVIKHGLPEKSPARTERR